MPSILIIGVTLIGGQLGFGLRLQVLLRTTT
jgi:hypothetical protein